MEIGNTIDNKQQFLYKCYMVPRHAENILLELAKGYPAIAITGPRQSGKTTLAKHVFNNKPYVSLENPDLREMSQIGVMGDDIGILAGFEDEAKKMKAQVRPAKIRRFRMDPGCKVVACKPSLMIGLF